MRSNTVQLTEAFDWVNKVIDPIYQFIMGTTTGKTFYSNPSNAWSAVWKAIGENVEKSFDSLTDWIKSLFKEGGIFNKLGKGIFGIIQSVHNWLSTIINKIPGVGNPIPGWTDFTFGNAIACGLLSALVIIAFYKIFKGLLGSDKEDDRYNYDRYSESIEQGNKIVVDFYNLTENIIYQQKYGILREGIFGGIFEFIGRTIRKGFKFVGEIFKDAYRGAKKHPILAFFVLVLCFFICFCMGGTIAEAGSRVAYMNNPGTPGILDQLKNVAAKGISTVTDPIAKGWDKVSTIANNFGDYRKHLIGFSEDVDLDMYVNTVFNKI